MIYQVSGDILLSSTKAIAHGVAPNDHFNQGLAHALRERLPSLYNDFRHYCKNHHPKVGTCWAWAGMGEKNELIIINLFTQNEAEGHGNSGHPGKASKENVNHALRELAKLIDKEKIPSLALPRLATGVGGLKWEEVLPLIETHLGKCAIPINIYTQYHAGVKAKETL